MSTTSILPHGQGIEVKKASTLLAFERVFFDSTVRLASKDSWEDLSLLIP
jgi:hypothetical protein